MTNARKTEMETNLDWQAPLRLEGLLKDTVTIFREHLGAFLLITLICIAPGVLLNLSHISWSADMSMVQLSSEQHPLSGLLTTLGAYVGYAALIHLTMRILARREMTTKEAMGRGFSSFLRVLWIAIGLTMTMAVGMLLFVIPGLIAGVAFCLAPIVGAVESKGLLASFRRSAELTRGHRLSLFGLFCLLFGICLIPVGINIGLAYALDSLTAYVLFSALWSLLATSLGTILLVNVYARLRAVYDGQAAYAATFR